MLVHDRCNGVTDHVVFYPSPQCEAQSHHEEDIAAVIAALALSTTR